MCSGSRPGQQSRRTSKAVGAGANSLLKQAIANRLNMEGGEPSFATSPSAEPARIHKTDSSEMSKSVLLNPAWYRDEQGRTGYKTSDWENVSNKQKNVVKESRKKKNKESGEDGGIIKELDTDLLSETSSVKSGSDNKSVDSVLSDSKMDKKAAKALAKEKKKQEKEQKKLEKAQKKKEADEEKKMKKKRGSSTNVSEIGQHESVEMKTVEKKKEKAEATITLTLVSKEAKESKEFKQSKKPKESDGSEEKKEKSFKGSDSQNQAKKNKDADKSKENSSSRQKLREADNDSSSKIIEGRPPADSSHMIVRKLKAENSKRLGTGEPGKKNIGDRRGSEMSELSRGSFKSVTFNDRVQTHEIERNSSVYTSSEDDAAIMSDDEMSKQSQMKMKKKLIVLQNPQRVIQTSEDVEDIYDDEDLDDFEEQERLALLTAQGYDVPQYQEEDEDDEEEESEDEEEDVDTVSQNSYYAEDVEGADIYLRNEHSFLGTDVFSQEQQFRNMTADYSMFDRTMMGSMSKLHGEDSSSNSLLFGYNLPRSASGYFEPPPDGHMNFSYEEAMLNRQAYHQQQLLQQLGKLPLQPTQPQKEVPGVHKLSPSGGSLRQTATQRSVYENVTPGDVSSQPQSLILPGSPSQRNQIARQEFFTQTPSNVVSKTIMAASSDGFSVASTDSNATIRVEDEMKKKFVARFGVRKAPIAREEDPADPKHVMGSQESMNSTDSRESVVSAASIKAEALARRNFNY